MWYKKALHIRYETIISSADDKINSKKQKKLKIGKITKDYGMANRAI